MAVFVHTLSGEGPSKWELLETHLEKVENLASHFGSSFHSEEWTAALGRCHDLGKGSREFQDYYLRISSGLEALDAGVEDSKRGRVNHSTFGARFVAQQVGGLQGQILAYCMPGITAAYPTSPRPTMQRRKRDVEGPPR